jgi:hypothetical protein
MRRKRQYVVVKRIAPRRKRPQLTFNGELAKPIDTGVIIPWDRKYWDEYIAKRQDKLFKLRMAKMPELARQLGIKFDHLDLADFRDLTAFYGHVALNLAVWFGIPGFQHAEPKWPPELVAAVLEECEKAKQSGTAESDLVVCLGVVQVLYPELCGNRSRDSAKTVARQLRNRVTALRARWRRDAAS